MPGFASRRRGRGSFRRPDEAAASDVLGSILLVATTVVMVAGLGAVLATQPGPTEQRHSNLTTSILQGSGDWGTGDEIIRIEHRGGESLDRSRTVVRYTIGGVTTTLDGTDLGGAFGDGSLRIGEVWTHTTNIPVNTPVGLDLVSNEDSGSSLISTNTLTASCGDDTTPPSVQTWTQGPADVKTSTTGAVTVTALVVDGCSGVNQAATPTLYWRLNDGTNPAYTNGGAMTLTATSTWQRTIPDPTWANHQNKVLQYYVQPITDLRANTGASTTQSDTIQADCGSDNQAPTVQTWTQSPSDVSASTSGAVLVTAVLTDNCAGVDNNANPELHYRINDGTNPAFTNGGQMGRTGTNTWQASIPDQGWSGQAGKTFEYELRLMKDLNANTGTSDRRSDLIQSSCAGDNQAPTVQTWTQAPADVTTAVTGVVTITAVLTDNCWGVDNTANPELHYRINDGTDPAFTNGGAMTRTAADTWQKAIPDQGWGTQGGKTLQYELRLMKDLGGNTGTSTLRSDSIQVVTVYTYVNSNTPTTGTVTSFGNAQSATDSDAEATLAEGNTAGAGATNTYNANAIVSAGSWTNGADGYGGSTNDVYATTTAETSIRYGFADQTGTPGTITTVVLKAEVSIVGYANDFFRLTACLNGGTCNTESGNLAGSANDVTILYDITSARPGGGSWTWTDVNNMEAIVRSAKQGSIDGTWRIDRVWFEVTYTTTPQYALDVRMDFAGVPSGSTQVLELRYRTTGDTYNVQVWDGSAYRTCTGTLNSGSLLPFTCSLTLPAEYQSGSPRIRFVDATPTGSTQGNLFLEYVRVKTN